MNILVFKKGTQLEQSFIDKMENKNHLTFNKTLKNEEKKNDHLSRYFFNTQDKHLGKE